MISRCERREVKGGSSVKEGKGRKQASRQAAAALRVLAAGGLTKETTNSIDRHARARSFPNPAARHGPLAQINRIRAPGVPSSNPPQRLGMGLQTRQAMAQGLDSRPTVEDFREDSAWVRLAKSHWLDGSKARKVKQDVLKKDLWDPLEAENFSFRSLLTLENLNILEKCASPAMLLRTSPLRQCLTRE